MSDEVKVRLRVEVPVDLEVSIPVYTPTPGEEKKMHEIEKRVRREMFDKHYGRDDKP